MRTDFTGFFDQIGCYLMPHPGKKVVADPKFIGKLEGEYFREGLEGNVHYQ